MTIVLNHFKGPLKYPTIRTERLNFPLKWFLNYWHSRLRVNWQARLSLPVRRALSCRRYCGRGTPLTHTVTLAGHVMGQVRRATGVAVTAAARVIIVSGLTLVPGET